MTPAAVGIAVALLVGAAGSAGAQRIRVDHVVVGGPSLAPMESLFVALGFAAEPGGRHSRSPTTNALIGFPDGSAIELLAPVDSQRVGTLSWSAAANAGPLGWAIRSDSVGADLARARAAGLSVTGPLTFGRTDARNRPIEFRLGFLGPIGPGPVLPFLIEEVTDRRLRVPAATGFATRFEGVSLVVIAVRDLDSAIVGFQRAFALARPTRRSDGKLGGSIAWWEGEPVLLLTAEGPGWIADRLRRFGDSVVGFCLGTGDGELLRQAELAGLAGWNAQWLDPRRTNGWLIGYCAKPPPPPSPASRFP